MTEVAKPLPDVDDPLTGPFWAATREGRLTAQRCEDCRYLRWPPGPICYQCQSPHSQWAELSGRGTLYSYAEYHQALDPAFADEIPYAVGLVDIDEGPRMYGRLTQLVQTTDIGRRVEPVFDAVSDRVTLVRWRLTEGKR